MGQYLVGHEDHMTNLLRKVTVGSFFNATTDTSNRQIEAFVLATFNPTDEKRLHNALVFEPGLK